ncbi:MAG: hypothetical protein IPH93_16585 [Saprospiraceae bacterium]|nr:hypothetical protein [Saprospiraceae bacterium]
MLLYFSCITEISSQVKVTSNNNVGVGTDNPHSSAKLEVHSENQGFLKPRMTTSQRNAINNPSVGLEVFDIDDNLTYWFNGTVWVTHGPGSGTGGTIVIAGTGIQVEGDGTSLSPYEIINTMQPNSESINGVISLLYNSETASSEHVNSTSNSSILSSYSIGTHSYDKVIIEAIVKSRVDNNVSRRTSFLWRFFRDNTLIDAYTCKILSDNTTGITGGGTYTNTLTAIVDGSEVQNVTLGITVQMDYAGNQTGGLVESFRVYGVADVELEGIVGPEGPEGPEGPAGQGGLTVEGANINVEGTGILGDPYVIINTFVEQDASITNEIQTLSTNLTPGHLHLTQSGTITLNVDDDDADPDNELQTLSINGNVLSISDKNSVTLPTGNNSATDLSYSGSSSPITLHSSTGTDVTITAGTEIGISGTASNITITNTYNDPDDDPGNEIQTLSTNNQPGNITLNPSGGTLNINVNDADASTSNEIKTLSINGNALTISHNGGNTVNLPAPGVGGGGTENSVAKFGPNGNNVINSELLNWTDVLANNSS